MEEVIERNNSSKKNRFIDKFHKLLLVFGALFGAGLAPAYIVGKYYIDGMHEAMEIPNFLLHGTVEEYAEFGSLFLFGGIVIISIVVGIVVFLWNYLLMVIKISYGKTLQQKTNENVKEATKENLLFRFFGRPFGFSIIFLFIVFCLLLGVFFVHDIAYSSGKREGFRIILTAPEIGLITEESIFVDSDISFVGDNPGIYSYSKLRFLKHMNGKYFVFSDINSETCSPEDVYIVNEEDVLLLTIHEVNTLDIPTQCVVPNILNDLSRLLYGGGINQLVSTPISR